MEFINALKVYWLVKEFIETNGKDPSLAEIGEAFSVGRAKATRAVGPHSFKCLARKKQGRVGG
jgi:hypothetical protein